MAAQSRALGSTIGVKALMALSGIALSGWLTLHMAGNLLVFSGAESINGYGELLRSEPALLWLVRLGLLGALGAHVGSAVYLIRRNRSARGAPYRHRRARGSVAARSMALSGALLLSLTAYHVLHIYGPLHPSYAEGDTHHNLVAGLAHPATATAYGLFAVLVGMHLHHGLWSAVRSLGLSGATGLDRWLDRGAVVLSVVLVVGFLAPLLAVVSGIL